MNRRSLYTVTIAIAGGVSLLYGPLQILIYAASGGGMLGGLYVSLDLYWSLALAFIFLCFAYIPVFRRIHLLQQFTSYVALLFVCLLLITLTSGTVSGIPGSVSGLTNNLEEFPHINLLALWLLTVLALELGVRRLSGDDSGGLQL